jgi:hypothetical protein
MMKLLTAASCAAILAATDAAQAQIPQGYPYYPQTLYQNCYQPPMPGLIGALMNAARAQQMAACQQQKALEAQQRAAYAETQRQQALAAQQQAQAAQQAAWAAQQKEAEAKGQAAIKVAKAKEEARQAAQKAAEESPDNICRNQAMGKMEIDQMNALQLSHHTGRQVIDIEHVTTIEAPSNAAETMVCHGTFLFSSGVREPGTVTFRKNLAGDPIIVWKSDLAY